jgi:hypothetical protein
VGDNTDFLGELILVFRTYYFKKHPKTTYKKNLKKEKEKPVLDSTMRLSWTRPITVWKI